MSVNPDSLRMRDMLVRSERIVEFIAGRSADDFKTDQLFQDAILHNILILGEAASRVTHEAKTQHPHIPWRQIVGIRNHIVHGYTKLDLDIVWQTVACDIPALLNELLKILPPEHN